MVCAPVVVEIEVHTAEERQQFHTRYNLDKYKALTQQLQHLLGQRLHQEGIDHSVVLNPELKGGWKPYFFVPNYYVKSDKSRKFYPRLGAFEVTVRCAEDFISGTGLPPCLELWSKLRTRRWPKPDRLVEDLARLLVAGRQGDETNSILRRIKGKVEEAEKLRCDSPATTASSFNLAKPPAGPIAVSLRGRSRPDSAPPSRARPESAPPAGDDAKASAPRRLQPLPRTSSASRPPLARPPSTSRPTSARAPPTSRPASARAPRVSRPASARSEHANSVKDGPLVAEEPVAAPQVPSPAAAAEEAAPQAAEEQLMEACQLADLLSGPAEVAQAAARVAQQEPPSITEAAESAQAQPAATPSPSPKHAGRGSYEDEEFEESEGGGSPKAIAPSPLRLTASQTLPANTDRFGSQQDQAEEFEAEFEEPIKGKADLSAESTDFEEELGAGAGERCKKSLTTGGSSSTSGSTRGTATPVDTAAATATTAGSFKDALQAHFSQSHRLSDEASGTSGSNLPSPVERGGGGDTARTALPPRLPEAPANDRYDDFEEDFEEDPPSAAAPDPAPSAASPSKATTAAPFATATFAVAPPTPASPSATAQPSAEPTPLRQPVAKDLSAADPSPTAAPTVQTPSAAAQPRPASAGPAVGLAAAGVEGEAKAAAADRSQTFEDPYDEGFEQTLTDERAAAAPGGGAAQEPPQQEEQRPQQQTLLPSAVAAATVQERPAAAAPADPRDVSRDPYDETFEQTLRDEPAGAETPEKETRETPEPAADEPAVAPAAVVAEECHESKVPAATATAGAPATPPVQESASPKKALERQPSLGITGDYDSDFEDD